LSVSHSYFVNRILKGQFLRFPPDNSVDVSLKKTPQSTYAKKSKQSREYYGGAFKKKKHHKTQQKTVHMLEHLISVLSINFAVYSKFEPGLHGHIYRL